MSKSTRPRDLALVLRQVGASLVALGDLLHEDISDAPSPDDLLKLAEAEQLVNAKPRTIRAQIRSGKLAATRVGRDYLVRRGDILALFAPTLARPTSQPFRVVRPLTDDERIEQSLRDAGISPRKRTA